ncbi:SpoIVB peptidase [Lentibacillus sp. JNUCC-1]|uniref:hypothetical protein n=1 Tax=Lentibacillus sp. JNUCC-1 TaxID=2654513 RepID=UPI001321C88C|nr:hypothetical protein [Lentibacillus sp. JNUCC-1]MUV39688.1 SpoIVB peptidase [Lentibacillus sp. JNUCC-1]
MLTKRCLRLTIGVLLLLALFSAPFLTPVQNYLSIPNDIVTFNNQSPIEIPKVKGNITVEASKSDMMTLQKLTQNFTQNNPAAVSLFISWRGFPLKR